jgi:hypothetical protein
MVRPPRAFIYSALGTGEVKCWQMVSASGYMNSFTTGQSRAAPASAPILAGLLWCSPVPFVLRLSAFSVGPFTFDSKQVKPACALQINSIVSWLTCLLLYSLHSLPMARKRGRPRRGAAWDARKAQRRRREQLERALALATSIIRKKAKEEKRALLATIAEPRAGCSRDEQDAGLEEVFPPCVVVEDPTMEDLTLVERTEATLQEKCTPTPVQDDYIPGCIVEEIPWPGDDNVSSHDSQAKEAGVVGATMAGEQRECEVGVEAATGTVDPSGSLHGSLLRNEHLALVFDLRGHLSDLEFRVCTMGQSMDMLLDAFSNAPAKRKCPLCAQAFAIPAGFMWQKDEDDRPPGT